MGDAALPMSRRLTGLDRNHTTHREYCSFHARHSSPADRRRNGDRV
jgi:hypothetical protein